VVKVARPKFKRTSRGGLFESSYLSGLRLTSISLKGSMLGMTNDTAHVDTLKVVKEKNQVAEQSIAWRSRTADYILGVVNPFTLQDVDFTKVRAIFY
jgi:hypothetical protein